MGKRMHEDDLAKHLADGITAKLNFDFACHRGHGFGETYVHGVLNEILCARTTPNKQRIECGYPVPKISKSTGRKREIDLAVIAFDKDEDLDKKGAGHLKCAIEVKWAGSSHCNEEKILSDLGRLQWLANNDRNVQCLFVVSGKKQDVDKLFKEKVFLEGTNSLLSRNAKKRSPNIKTCRLKNNPDHEKRINKHINSLSNKDSWVLDEDVIKTQLVSPEYSAPGNGRFLTYTWKLVSSLS